MIDEMAKTIIKKCTEFIFTNQSNERFDRRKADLAEELKIDVKTVDRHLKRLAESDCPIQLILHKKTVQLVYDQGYSEPYLLFVFLIQSPRFVY